LNCFLEIDEYRLRFVFDFLAILAALAALAVQSVLCTSLPLISASLPRRPRLIARAGAPLGGATYLVVFIDIF
jgi:hypothetical protein